MPKEYDPAALDRGVMHKQIDPASPWTLDFNVTQMTFPTLGALLRFCRKPGCNEVVRETLGKTFIVENADGERARLRARGDSDWYVL